IWRDVAIHPHRLGKLRIMLIALESSLAEQIATLHAAMLLCLRQRVYFFRDLHLHSGQETLAIARPEWIRIESDPFKERRNTTTAISQRQGNRIVGMARRDISGRHNGSSRGGLDLDQIGNDIEIDVVAHLLGHLVDGAKIVGANAQLLGRRGTDQRDIVPCDLALKIWSFLEPRIVRVSPVVHASALEKEKFDPLGPRLYFPPAPRGGA